MAHRIEQQKSFFLKLFILRKFKIFKLGIKKKIDFLYVCCLTDRSTKNKIKIQQTLVILERAFDKEIGCHLKDFFKNKKPVTYMYDERLG